MRLDKVVVLGGGPGGLYLARLLKLADPDSRVEVIEQGRPETTFGFGVGLAAGTQRNLRAADQASLEEILAAGRPHDMVMQVGQETARISNENLRGIARTTLLEILLRHALDAGVLVHHGRRLEPDEIASLEADLIVAADGVSSAVREHWAADFGASVETGEGLYLWAGVEFALQHALFTPATTEHGTFVAHAYPYAADRSTFLIETDEETWRRCAFPAEVPPEESDEQSLTYLSQAFAPHLNGLPLIGNRTRWLRFRTIRCERWSRGNVVLMGDAAHTAHYSIGSGTKLAMEDAISLVAAIGEAKDLDGALAAYERERRPSVEHLQSVAGRSQRWWDSFPQRLHLPVDQLLVNYMTRAGKVSLDRLQESAPAVLNGALRAYRPDSELPDQRGRDVVDWVVSAAEPAGASPEGPAVPIGVREIRVESGMSPVDELDAETVRLTGPGDRDAVLDRLDLGERMRLERGVTVITQAPDKYLADLAAGLVSGRTDQIEATTGEEL